jgi:hypothetical protein
VDVFAMAEFQYENCDALILDIADKAVVADAIAPKPTLLSLESFAELTRIGRR